MMKFLLGATTYNIPADKIGVPKSTGTVSEGLANITQVAMGLVGALAVIALIVGGIQLALSAGDAKRYQQARETILYAVVGIAVAIAAYAIVGFIADSVKGK
jgi:hypothetical protein